MGTTCETREVEVWTYHICKVGHLLRKGLSPLHIRHVVDKFGPWVVGRDGDNLPVQLPRVDHGEHAERLDLVHAASLVRLAPNLNDVDGVIVSLRMRVKAVKSRLASDVTDTQPQITRGISQSCLLTE